jgi:hypothetical protein
MPAQQIRLLKIQSSVGNDQWNPIGGSGLSADWASFKKSTSDGLAGLRDKHAERRVARDAQRAEKGAERADDFAEECIAWAIYAVVAAEYAVVDAALAHADAEAAAAAAG